MYIRKKYRVKDMIRWTRRELRFFMLYAAAIAILYALVGLSFLTIPWTPIALVGTAVAFLIGFQNNAAYGRLWEARQIWGAIINDSRMFGIMVKDMITNEYAAESATEEQLGEAKRRIIYRHMAWLTALRHAMRQKKPWERQDKTKQDKEWTQIMHIPEFESGLADDLCEFLSEEERQKVLATTNKAATILSLQSQDLRALKERGLIWEFSFLELEGKLNDLINHQGKSERIKNFPYPRQYATIGYDFVNLFIFILPLGIVPEFSEIGQELGGKFPGIEYFFVWLSVPFSALVSWIFNTMQRIGTAGENPFEGSPNDVPISTISRGIEIDLREMLGEEKENIPEPYPTVYDVQM